LTEPLLQRLPPRHELKAQTIVDDGETTRCQREPMAIDAGDVLAFCRWPMRKANFSREFRESLVQLPPTQGIEQITCEDDSWAPPPRQSLLDEVTDTSVHRLAHFGSESTAAGYGFPREELSIEPSGAARRDLRLKFKIRTRRKG